MKLHVLSLLLAASSLLAACGGGSDPKTSVAVIGDMPYGTSPTDTSQFVANPAFVGAINQDAELSLAMHVGDIHSGKEYCTEAYDKAVSDQWKAFRVPMVYTPGDNEWADCHKVAQGGGSYSAATGTIGYVLDAKGTPVDYAKGDPAANLQLVRSIFFAAPGQALGAGSMAVHSQALEFDPAFPADRAFVENVWWEQSGVLFVTLNVPGGSNNDTDPWYGAPAMSASQAAEVATRTEADKRWLDAAFKRAAANGNRAMVIQLQADMWNFDGAAASHISQYRQFIDLIAAGTSAFGKPVLLFNGDTHVYRSDNPLSPGAACVVEPSSGAAAVGCTSATVSAAYGNADASLNQPGVYNVANFRRVTVHGSTTPLEWLKLTIDPDANAPNGPDAFGPFRWKRVHP